MRKKSIFERFGLVESSNKIDEYDDFDVNYENSEFSDTSQETQYVNVEMQGEGFLSIEEIYKQLNLHNLDRSIFKVDEYSNVLPNSLPATVKRESVIGILTASNLTVDELISDAEKRIVALDSVKKVTTDSTHALILEKEKQIADLLASVDILKQEINDRELSQETQDKIIKEESEKIKDIVKFLNV